MSIVLSTLDIEVRWRDLDAFNHVNNASYLGYAEEARVRWFQSLSDDWAAAGAAPILAAITMNYRRPLGWPEIVRVELRTERLGNKSLTLDHRIVSVANPDILYADGHAVMVWTDRSGQSIALPDSIRSACA